MSASFPPFHRYNVRVLDDAGRVREVTILAPNACGAEMAALETVSICERVNRATLLVTYVCMERPS